MEKWPETLPDLSQLSHEQKDDIIRSLFPLIAQVRRLSARVAELEARLSKDSHNSSKPPSSDGLAKKSASPNIPSGKKPGAQPGHVGKTLERSTRVDIPINHPLPQYCTWQTHCVCGQVQQSEFPANVTEAVQYGPNVRALAVHLTHGQLLPLLRSAQLITEWYGLSVSPGTVCAWGDQASRILLPKVADIAQLLIDLPVVGADESGLRVASRLNWLHTVASEKLTWYGVHPQRGLPAIEDHGILPNLQGTAVHDCWPSYWRLTNRLREHADAVLRFVTDLRVLSPITWPSAPFAYRR